MDPLKELIASLTKLEFGSSMTAEEKDEDITKQIADHYLPIIRALVEEVTVIRLNANNLSHIELNGEIYDLDQKFSHNNREIAEHRIAIEAILSDLVEDGEDMGEILATVEEILNIP